MARPLRILFLCTGNSARSILAEAILNHEGAGRFQAVSAGSAPKSEVHPMALETLVRAGLPTDGLRSKSWDEFAGPGAPSVDVIITVCGNAAGETCPIWPGKPATAHWGIDDPAAVEGDGQRAAFADAFRRMGTRIGHLLALPPEDLDAGGLRTRLGEIGEIGDD